MVSGQLLDEFGFTEEERESGMFHKGTWNFEKTGFPKPDRSWRVMLEAFGQSIEEPYFWMLNHIRQTVGYSEIDKITDLFAAAEQSSFFGAAQSRLGIQQDKVSQFLATVGKMIKELFQLVRELRIIDERLGYYADSWSDSKSRESAEITLKGIWIDLVEQGAKNPASVYGMARELQFVTLPDLFFSIHPRNAEQVDEFVNRLDEFNRKVREVLKRKLRSFIEWKHATNKELNTRRTFTIKYLRQHYDIIQMYMNWVKPYLHNIQRLQMAERSGSPDLVNAFEGALVEIELLAKKLPMKTDLDSEPHRNTSVYSVMLVNFNFRTRPQMSFQQEGYHKGPIHVGRLDMDIRTYAWDGEKIEKYKKMKEKETFELMMHVDESVRTAMDSMGEEMLKYLEEAGEEMKKKDEPEKKKPKGSSALEPFIGVVKGFGDLLGPLAGMTSSAVKGKKVSGKQKYKLAYESKVAASEAKSNAFILYHFFKKDRGMLEWG
ncbi:MAG: hypothetical protein ABIC95_04110 [archaeon]